MKVLNCIFVGAITIGATAYWTNIGGILTGLSHTAVEKGARLVGAADSPVVQSGSPELLPQGEDEVSVKKEARLDTAVPNHLSVKDQARLQDALPRRPQDRIPATQDDLSYLAYYAYSEIPPDKKPADTILESLKDVPVGTPVEEIKHASDALGLDFTFMRTVAKIESDFDPKQRTGSYIGLFQLSHEEFAKYGSGEITDARDNAVAAAYKFAIEAKLFELETLKKPTFSDLYLIHQQGWQGAAEHVAHPERIAWQSMCATDEGKEKGERWCKRAIWGNTLPTIKRVWKSVNKLTSGAFVAMWRERVDHLYARYADATSEK